MPTSRQSSGKKGSTSGKTLPELTREIDQTVDKLVECPKSRTDHYIRKLKSLQRKRDALAVGEKRGLEKDSTSTMRGSVTTVDGSENSNEQAKCEASRAGDTAGTGCESPTDEGPGSGGSSSGEHPRGGEAGGGEPVEADQGHDAGPDRPSDGPGNGEPRANRWLEQGWDEE